jgi:formylglycine-generating enzyme required for sulfatase activity
VRITIPSEHWRERKRFLPEERGGWDQPPNPAHAVDWLSSTRAWGDAWLWSGESLIAEVPSVIVPEESNLLLNPRHPSHREVVPIPAGEFLMGSPDLEPGRQACEGP